MSHSASIESGSAFSTSPSSAGVRRIALAVGLLIGTLVALISLALSLVVYYEYHIGGWGLPFMPKLLMPVYTPPLAIMGIVYVCVGIWLVTYRGRSRSIARQSVGTVIALAGLVTSIVAFAYIVRVTAPHDGFERAFGPEWTTWLSPEREARMLQRRYTPFWRPRDDARLLPDVVVGTIPGTGRELLADLWLPPEEVEPSGLAFVYFHGSAWHFWDKDTGTRPMFRHLAEQGHVVLDVAYRLAPETDVPGMVQDVRRAVVWMKEQGADLGVDPGRIVIGGGSAGGHIALLAAYAPLDEQRFTPSDLEGQDASVHAVVSYYGPNDMWAYMEHSAAQMLMSDKQVHERHPVTDESANWLMEYNTTEQWMMNMLGGMPDEVPEMYDLASPVQHVSPGDPPTLLVQGEDDFVTSVTATRALASRLEEAGVPVVNVVLPDTEHGFDIFTSFFGLGDGSQFAPPTQAALYDLDRFLAIMALR